MPRSPTPTGSGRPATASASTAGEGSARWRSTRSGLRRSAASSAWIRQRWRRRDWTHWEDLRNIYGVAPNGFARQTWDNVGVQYGLGALTDENITPQEFLDLNARVGTWRDPEDLVQEGPPFGPPLGPTLIPGLPPITPPFDPWSSRNMQLSPDGGDTPAPRREGDVAAMNAAYERGLYFDGEIDIPLIDWRHYLEEELDMHNSHQSFASRQRMLDRDGDASNQVIWFTDARPEREFDQTPEALEVIDEWMANIRDHPDAAWPRTSRRSPRTAASPRRARRSRAASTSGTASSTTGPTARAPSSSRFTPPRGSSPAGRCAAASTSARCSPWTTRSRAGCTDRGTRRAAQVARLKEIFPTGVCDYSQADVGRP